jgi:hypothetical protein
MPVYLNAREGPGYAVLRRVPVYLNAHEGLGYTLSPVGG